MSSHLINPARRVASTDINREVYLWVTECPLDELWSFVHTKEQNLGAAQQWCKTDGDPWVWVAFAPVWRWVVAFVVGQPTQESAH